MTINPNDPAFPNSFVDKTNPGVNHTIVVDGLSIRAWLAGQALSGMLQREHAFSFLDDDPSSGHTVASTTSNYAPN